MMGFGVRPRPLDRSAPIPGMLVYFIQHDVEGPIKIGIALSPEARMQQLQAANPFKLHLRLKLSGGAEEEKLLHQRFQTALIRGEWFRPVPELLQLIAQPPKDLRAYLGLPQRPTHSLGSYNIRDLQKAAQQRLKPHT